MSHVSLRSASIPPRSGPQTAAHTNEPNLPTHPTPRVKVRSVHCVFTMSEKFLGNFEHGCEIPSYPTQHMPLDGVWKLHVISYDVCKVFLNLHMVSRHFGLHGFPEQSIVHEAQCELELFRGEEERGATQANLASTHQMTSRLDPKNQSINDDAGGCSGASCVASCVRQS